MYHRKAEKSINLYDEQYVNQKSLTFIRTHAHRRGRTQRHLCQCMYSHEEDVCLCAWAYVCMCVWVCKWKPKHTLAHISDTNTLIPYESVLLARTYTQYAHTYTESTAILLDIMYPLHITVFRSIYSID